MNDNKNRQGRRPIVRDSGRDGLIPDGIVYGRNGVRELLKSGRSIDKIFVRRGDREGSINVIIADAAERGIPVIDVEREKLDRMTCNGSHQGVVALAASKDYCSIDDILQIAAERGEMPFIVILDGVEDPYNLGAVVRSAECAGCHGVIIPKRRAAGLSATAEKASAGALEHIAVAKVVNIASAIDSLKEKGIWIYAAEADGDNLYCTDMDRPSAIVFGSEGAGVSRLVREKCDFAVSIPLYGKVNSLNVSAAAAVVLCEAARQRHTGGVSE